MDIVSFQKRMGLSPNLIKAVHPDDFAGIRNETDPAGPETVDHTFDLSAHPQTHNIATEHYRQAIHGKSPMLRTTPIKLAGVSPKAVYSLPQADKIPNSDKVLVKPYHEGIHEKAKFWMNHPIQGWAEMTNQALWHAADMGGMHQRVHVSEHDMGPGFDKSPALVVHMEPNAKFVRDMEPTEYSPDMQHDLFKIGAMDFLTNNLDRHRANLLVLPEGQKDHMGMPRRSRWLGIDHSRSFQYHASNKGAATVGHDPILGTYAISPEEQAAYNLKGKTSDHLLRYMQSDALKFASQYSKLYGQPSLLAAKNLVPALAGWWTRVRDRVIGTLHSRMQGIRDPKLREHILKNFGVRTALLDDIAARPDYFINESKSKDLQVPLYPYERL